MKSDSLTRTAPATTPSTRNGAIGTSRSAVIATSPRRRSTCRMPLSFLPAIRRTVLRSIFLPSMKLTQADSSMPSIAYTKPISGPNAITANSVTSGRGNSVNATGV